MADSKPVKQEVNGTMILPPLVSPDLLFDWFGFSCMTTDKFFVFICKTDQSKPVKQVF
jgi:hypothetical protein